MASVKVVSGAFKVESDHGIHLPILNAINNTGMALEPTVQKLINLGYTEQEIKDMTGYAKVFKYNPNHHPAGSSKGGQFAPKAGAKSSGGLAARTGIKTPEDEFKLVSEFLHSLNPVPPPARGSDLHQPGVSSIDDLYKQAEKGQKEYDKMLAAVKKGPPPAPTLMINSPEDYNKIIDGFSKGKPKGPVVVLAAVKGKDRLSEKIDKEYNGDASRVGDVVRGSVVVDSIYEIDEVLDKLKATKITLAREPNNRFERPTGAGYRDLMMNVVLPSGHIAELQIHTKAMFVAKDAGHKLYEIERSIEPAIKKGTANAMQHAEYLAVQAKQRKIYEAAWLKSQGGVSKMEKAEKGEYYIFDGMIPAKVEKKAITGGFASMRYLYRGKGIWKWHNNPESWDMNAVPVSKKEFDALVAKFDKTK